MEVTNVNGKSTSLGDGDDDVTDPERVKLTAVTSVKTTAKVPYWPSVLFGRRCI